MRRFRVPVALLALVGSAACDDQPSIRPVPGAPVVERGNLKTTAIVFATDDYYFRPTTVDAEQGRLRVPERHDRPNGRQYELHFVRFPSTARQLGFPIVYLAGGPGGSGSRSAAGDRFKLFMHLRRAGDVIALDQRGVWPSTPHPSCPDAWSYPLDREMDAATLREVMRPWLQRCAAHWRDSVEIAAFNTSESADDLEDLRRALGAAKLNLWGISYGTHLALAYIRKYPDRVHRAILAGVEGPDHTWKSPARIEQSLRRLDSAVAADARATKRIGRFLARVRRTLDSLERHPISVETVDRRTKQKHRVTVGKRDLQRALFFAQGERDAIRTLFTRLGPILEGDFEPLAQFAYRTRLDNADLVMALSTDCAAGATPARLARIDSEAPATILGDIATLELRSICPNWPVTTLPHAMREPIQSPVSVMAISGTLDNRTPPENAVEVLRGFPNAHHLIIDGAAHDDDLFLSDAGIREAMLRYLLTGDPGTRRIELPPLQFTLP